MFLGQQELTAVTTSIGNPQDDFRAYDDNEQIANMSRTEYDTLTSEEDEIDYHEGNTEMTCLLISSDATPIATKSKALTIQPTYDNNNDFDNNPLRPGMNKQQCESEELFEEYGNYSKQGHGCSTEDNVEHHSQDVKYVVAAIPSPYQCSFFARFCFFRNFKSTLLCMNHMARLVLWATAFALVVAVIWYSYELHNHG
jgi:hypothetical protein